MQKIDAFIGMDPVKDEIWRIADFARIVKLKKERDLPVVNLNFHMVFTGPPGTGKTSIAREIGKLLYELKLLRKGDLVEVTKADLVGTHLGESEELTTNAVKKALDGVLFVDEAYSLAGGGGRLSQPDPYGQAAIDTLLVLMENYRDRLVCIFAGYSDKMIDFVESNPGLKSRISRTINFPSYNREELTAIFRDMIEQNGFKLTENAWAESYKVIADLVSRADENFGNAREIRQFFEALQPIQAQRLAERLEVEGIDESEISDEELMRIEEEDVREYLKID